MTMDSDRELDCWLQAARADLGTRTPSPLLEQALLVRLRERAALRLVASAQPKSVAARPARRPWWQRWTFTLPAAAATLLALALGARTVIAPMAAPSVARAATPFFALVGAEALAAARVPLLVTSQVSRTELANYGLPVDPSRADEPVAAEFLMSRSGVVLAVRFVE